MAANDALVRLDLTILFFRNICSISRSLTATPPWTHSRRSGHRPTQLYRDNGLKWKIVSVKPPSGIDAIYSLRITQSRRCAQPFVMATTCVF